MKSIQRMRVGASLLILTIALLAGGCGHETARRNAAAPIQVRTAIVAASEGARVIDAVGSLRAASEAVLSGKMMGSVLEIRKEAGDLIRRGEILLVIDGRDVSGQIEQAQGSLAQARAAMVLAETNLKRFEQLHGRGSASQLELDQARYQFETTKGAVQQAEGAVATAGSYKAYAEIAAPFDGRVVDRMCDVGDLATPGRPLMKVENGSRMRLFVSLPESDVGLAIRGGSVAVEVPSLGGPILEGQVADIVPAADPMTRTFLVKIDLPENPALRSGFYARALFRGAPRQAIRLPRAAILARGGLTGVFAVEGDRATFRLITVAESPGDSVEVLSGLREGVRIILSPPAMLEEGSPIEVQG
jgi:RND family efflux transporter MFP subunit